MKRSPEDPDPSGDDMLKAAISRLVERGTDHAEMLAEEIRRGMNRAQDREVPDPKRKRHELSVAIARELNGTAAGYTLIRYTRAQDRELVCCTAQNLRVLESLGLVSGSAGARVVTELGMQVRAELLRLKHE